MSSPSPAPKAPQPPCPTLRSALALAALAFSTLVAAAQFRPAVSYPAGLVPFDVVTADLNGDGILDLVLADAYFGAYGGAVGVYLGKGDGTFAPEVEYPSGGEDTYSVAVGDFNRDGHPDIVVANGGGSTALLLGNGDGSFQTPVQLISPLQPRAVAAADLNHDGKLDLMVAGNIGVSVLLGNGDGTFQAPVNNAAAANFIAVADLNQDGIPDMAVAGEIDGVVSIFLGNGDGTFKPAQVHAAGPGAVSIAVADLNGDGALDLAVANAASSDNGAKGSTVNVLLGKGDGTFQIRRIFPAGNEPFSVAIGDINHDGALDLLVADAGGQFGTSHTVSLLLGDGTGNFGKPSPFTVGEQPISIALADFNRDHALDAAVANFNDNTLSVLLNTVVPACTKAPKIAHLHAVPYQLSPADNTLVPVTVAYDVVSSCGGTPTCRIGVSSNPATDPADQVILDPHHIQLRAKPLPKSPHPITYRVNVRCVDTSGNTTDSFTPVPVIP